MTAHEPEDRSGSAARHATLVRSVRQLEHAGWRTRRTLLQALTELGLEEELARLVGERPAPEWRTAALIDALVAAPSRAVPHVLALTHSTEPAVVADAALILGRRAEPSAVPRLTELVRHEDDNVAIAAIEALGRIRSPEALDVLADAASSESFFRAFPAIDVLGRSESRRALGPLVRLLSAPRLASVAARALGRLGDTAALTSLAEQLNAERDATVIAVGQAIARIVEASPDKTSGVAMVRAGAPAGSAGRLEALRAAGGAGADASLSELLDWLRAPPVRPAAEAAPEAMGSRAFGLFRDLIHERAGLRYREADAPLLASKLEPLAEAAGGSLLDFYYSLRYDDPDGEATQALIEALVVHESYLFREEAVLTFIVESIVRPRHDRGLRSRIWSAACARGEEPFSLAMRLADAGVLDSTDLLASDISSRALDAAKRGLLSRRALRRAQGRPELARYTVTEGEHTVVTPRIRDSVEFRRINLKDRAHLRGLGPFDAVLLRNALIYFDDQSASEVLENVGGLLDPHGAIFVGISESLLRFGRFQCDERDGIFFYRPRRDETS